MLFLVFGSSGSGKTVALAALRGRVPRLAVHDFDEIDVPADADTAWRHGAEEEWVRRAIDLQEEGIDFLLAGQTPLGELVATPSASRLEAISACLLDCDDATRIARMERRGPEWLEMTGGTFEAYLGWATWMREHAADPSARREVIRPEATAHEMQWARMDGWEKGDPRWRVRVIDTAVTPIEYVAAELVEWIEAERALLSAAAHPLTGPSLDAR